MLTAFLLPWGRYVYTVAPMGLNPSGDWWCKKSDEALVGLEGVTKLVDDILVQAADEDELLRRMEAVLLRCRQHGITLSRKKVEVGEEVNFAGHKVSADGVRPDPTKLDAIAQFPTPTDVTALKSFFGLANQLGTYLPDLAQATDRLRALLKKGVAWVWTPEHQAAFEEAKRILTSPAIVKYFDPTLRSSVYTDASRAGLGYVLIQHTPDGGAHLIACGSRALNSAEKRYAPVELECLGVVFAVSKLDFFMGGSPKPFQIVTDHRPLIGTFNRPLSETVNPRIQRLRLKLVGKNIDVVWQPGKRNRIADALSRAPVLPPTPLTEEDSAEEVAFVRRASAVSGGGMRVITEAAQDDDDYQQVIDVLQRGVDPKNLPTEHPARAFKNIWERMAVTEVKGVDVLTLDFRRVIVPRQARSSILDFLHKPHSGLVKTRRSAQLLYYWPGMNAAIEDRIGGCPACRSALPSLPSAPVQEVPSVDRPMQQVAVDFFQWQGVHYLVMVDRFSGFPFVHRMTRTDATSTTKALTRWFAQFGFPDVIRSDGGPPFTSTAFRTYCWDHDIEREVSSPYNPRSNGLAEAAVKNTKSLLKKCVEEGEDYHLALHEFCNCPRADGYSPAMLMFGRRTKSTLPALPISYDCIDVGAGREARERTAEKRRMDTSSRPGGHSFEPGDAVLAQDPITKVWGEVAEILSREGDSYTLFLQDKEKVVRRNKMYLRPHRADAGIPGEYEPESCEVTQKGKGDDSAMRDRSVIDQNMLITDDPSPTPLRRSSRLRQKASQSCSVRRVVHFSLPNSVLVVR